MKLVDRYIAGMVAAFVLAAVFAFASGTPFAIIPYHTKCLQFAREIGLPRHCVLLPDTLSYIDGACVADACGGVEGDSHNALICWRVGDPFHGS